MSCSSLKRLQEQNEERWQFQALAVMDGMVRAPKSPREVILLLHGLNERGRRIYRKLLPYLPHDALIIAPNAPFPLPRQKENRMVLGYTWYFYDKFERNYYLNQDMARSWLRELLKLKNPDKLPLTVIGFSQGGYLAPLLGSDIPETKLVIGLGCEFRSQLITHNLHFPLIGLHGKLDTIITHESSLREAEVLRSKGIQCHWQLIEDAAHEITPSMGKKVKEILEAYGNRSL